jgi:hypothetical protein
MDGKRTPPMGKIGKIGKFSNMETGTTVVIRFGNITRISLAVTAIR